MSGQADLHVCFGFTLVCLTFSVCGPLEQNIVLATASADHIVRIWWAPGMRMQCLAELPGHTDQVCGMVLNASFSHTLTVANVKPATVPELCCFCHLTKSV